MDGETGGEFNGPLPVNNGHVELVEDRLCKHDTPTESDPGEGIKTALIRAGSKLCLCVRVRRGVFNKNKHIVLVI